MDVKKTPGNPYENAKMIIVHSDGDVEQLPVIKENGRLVSKKMDRSFDHSDPVPIFDWPDSYQMPYKRGSRYLEISEGLSCDDNDDLIYAQIEANYLQAKNGNTRKQKTQERLMNMLMIGALVVAISIAVFSFVVMPFALRDEFKSQGEVNEYTAPTVAPPTLAPLPSLPETTTTDGGEEEFSFQ